MSWGNQPDYHHFIVRVNDVKTGTLIGMDKYGNKYYEDKKHYFFGESHVHQNTVVFWRIMKRIFRFGSSRKMSKMCSGRHRWVIYTMEMNGKKTLWEVDGSMVPAEWYDLQCYRINMNNDNTSK